MRRLAPLLLSAFAMLFTGCASCPEIKPTPDRAAPLDLVVKQVEAALHEYQQNLGEGDYALPALASAVFDFKATSVETDGGSISFLIFKFGTSRECTITNDVIFTYSLPEPKPHKGPGVANRKAPELKDILAKTIQGAAAAVKKAHEVGSLPFSKLTVKIEYGVKWEGDATAGAQLSFVTVGVSGAKSSNTVQSVSLTFGQ